MRLFLFAHSFNILLVGNDLYFRGLCQFDWSLHLLLLATKEEGKAGSDKSNDYESEDNNSIVPRFTNSVIRRLIIVDIGITWVATSFIVSINLSTMLANGVTRWRLRHLFIAQNHIGIIIAPGPRHSNLFVVDIEDKVVLSHECAAQENLSRTTKFLNGHAVLIALVSEEVLAREPLQFDFCLIETIHMKVKEGIALKVGLRTLREKRFIIFKANS
jgi:hypothetical protein